MNDGRLMNLVLEISVSGHYPNAATTKGTLLCDVDSQWAWYAG